jgi:hypothetical protein
MPLSRTRRSGVIPEHWPRRHSAVRRLKSAARRPLRSRRGIVDHDLTVTTTRHRTPSEKAIRRSSRLVGAAVASVLIFVISVGATIIGVAPGIGDAEPGFVRASAIGWAIAGMVGVVVTGCIAWPGARCMRPSFLPIGFGLLAVAAAIVVNVQAYRDRVGGIDDGQHYSGTSFFLALGLLIALPFAALVIARLTRSGGRAVILVAVLSAIINLSATLLFSINHLG